MRIHVALSLVLLSLAVPRPALSETTAAFEAAQSRIIEEARLDAFVRQYEDKVKAPGDLARVFDYGRKHKYQREWMSLAKSGGPLPRLSREGRVLVLHFAEGHARLDFSEFARNQVVVEGVRLAFDPSAPPRLQAELLSAKLRASLREGGSASLWDVLLPRAEAGMPDLVGKPTLVGRVLGKICKGVRCTIFTSFVTAMGLWSGNVQDNVGKAVCYFNYSMDIKWPFKAGMCVPWLEQHEAIEKRERERGVANWGALKGRVKWISDPNPKCMNKDAKGTELYSFNMTEVGPGISSREKVFFTGKGSNGLLTDASVYRSEDDAKAPDAASRALAQFIFTEDPKQTAAGVPPALNYVRVLDDTLPATSDVDRHQMVDLSKRPKDVPLSVTDKVFRYVAMIGSAQKWLIACQEISESAKLNPALAEDTVKTIITNEKDKKTGQQPEDAVGTSH